MLKPLIWGKKIFDLTGLYLNCRTLCFEPCPFKLKMAVVTQPPARSDPPKYRFNWQRISSKASIHMHDAQRDLTVLVDMIYSAAACPKEMEHMWIHALQLPDSRLFHCNIACVTNPSLIFSTMSPEARAYLKPFN